MGKKRPGMDYMYYEKGGGMNLLQSFSPWVCVRMDVRIYGRGENEIGYARLEILRGCEEDDVDGLCRLYW